MRLESDHDENLDVQMSPLIDCVFLLLIFFLVTTMMKKWEMQIPLTLPSITSSLSTAKIEEYPILLAVDEKRRLFQIVSHDAYSGEQRYIRIRDFDLFLNNILTKKGTGAVIEVTAYRNVPIEIVIEVFDKCQIKGFSQTKVRLGSKPQ